ncbi:hypothetical protein BQ8482_570022 [Mesorhizobium delmotii]|uniref:Uncharacterized protein n=1 Tax=Mesorhizobium delmotii TaxID=1631247 RepID=A0A2P9AV29_9HYPH|nr:hypothetical protein BQ8482_570022 [Mesorhizobium delmotii]
MLYAAVGKTIDPIAGLAGSEGQL